MTREVTGTAQRDELTIHYVRVGEGPRLLLCNGSGASIAGSRPLIEFLAQRFDVVVHDQRGLGLTGPGDESRFTMRDYALDAACVMDAVKWDRAHVVGISFGGMVALEFAVESPDRIDRLALLCTSSGGAGGSSFPLESLAGLSESERRDRMRHILDSRFTDEWLETHPADRALLAALTTRASRAPSSEQRRGIAGQLRARSAHDVFDRLGKITSPTLVAAGRYDGQAPLANSEVLASRIPHAQLQVFEGGHLFARQDPTALPSIAAFLLGTP